MIKTFNCGIGFCIIVKKKKIFEKIKKFFSKKYMPYEIGNITKNNVKIKLLKTLKW